MSNSLCFKCRNYEWAIVIDADSFSGWEHTCSENLQAGDNVVTCSGFKMERRGIPRPKLHSTVIYIENGKQYPALITKVNLNGTIDCRIFKEKTTEEKKDAKFGQEWNWQNVK